MHFELEAKDIEAIASRVLERLLPVIPKWRRRLHFTRTAVKK